MSRLTALVLAAAVALPVTVEALELEGTWHVLVHYKDSSTNKPDRERWEDRLWVIEDEGTRLEWTEYPIVVFQDPGGRFERLGTNRQSRVLGYWEPNAAQRAQIAAGLEFNSRGSKKKTLRPSKDGGWTSARGGAGYESARFITYSETWSIEGPADLPRFVRVDSLGSASAEEFSGKTVYETTAVESNGDVLVGRYERDGTRSGTFRLTRSGAASTVKGSGKTQGERVYEAFFGQAAGQLLYSGATDEDLEQELKRKARAGELSDEQRREVRERFEDSLTEIYRSQGNDPRAHRADIVKLARKMERAYLDDGKTLEEIQQMIASGAMRP